MVQIILTLFPHRTLTPKSRGECDPGLRYLRATHCRVDVSRWWKTMSRSSFICYSRNDIERVKELERVLHTSRQR